MASSIRFWASSTLVLPFNTLLARAFGISSPSNPAFCTALSNDVRSLTRFTASSTLSFPLAIPFRKNSGILIPAFSAFFTASELSKSATFFRASIASFAEMLLSLMPFARFFGILTPLKPASAASSSKLIRFFIPFTFSGMTY